MTMTDGGSELAVPRPVVPDSADGFARLYDDHAAGLHRYLARRVGEHTAYDLVSETFLVAFRQRSGYDPERAGPRAWIYGIATNLLRRHVRQEIRGLRAVERVARREPPAVAAHD